MKLYSIIFADSDGKKFNSSLPASLQKLCEKTLLDRLIGITTEAGSDKQAVIVKENSAELFEQTQSNTDYIAYSKSFYTCDVLLRALSALGAHDGSVIIANTDTPLITSEALSGACRAHADKSAALTVICAPNTADDLGKAEYQGTYSDIYIYDIRKFKDILAGHTTDCCITEACMSEIAEEMINRKEVVLTYRTDFEEVLRVTDFATLAKADTLLNKRFAGKLMNDGVCILNPDIVRVSDTAKIGCGTVIYPNTILEGSIEIGNNCVIGPNTRIVNCSIGNNTEIQYSVLYDSTVGSNTSVGPFAYIRPNSKIGDNIKVGDFVEVKNASVGNNTKIAHLTYVGDADVGERVNFGCGTVVVNYDGIHKHRTTIEDDCFIGCNTNLVSPVTIRKGAYTAAGSTITDEVPADALAIARSRQVIKDGWAKGKKK